MLLITGYHDTSCFEARYFEYFAIMTLALFSIAPAAQCGFHLIRLQKNAFTVVAVVTRRLTIVNAEAMVVSAKVIPLVLLFHMAVDMFTNSQLRNVEIVMMELVNAETRAFYKTLENIQFIRQHGIFNSTVNTPAS